MFRAALLALGTSAACRVAAGPASVRNAPASGATAADSARAEDGPEQNAEGPARGGLVVRPAITGEYRMEDEAGHF